MRIVSIFTLTGCLLTVAASAQQYPVSLAIDAQSPGPAIAPDFGVFSFETGSLRYDDKSQEKSGYFFSPTNTQLITLFQNLGVRSVRIGGNSVDGSYIPSTGDMDSFFGFAKAAGVKAVFSLGLVGGAPSTDASIARYLWTHYKANIICLAIGNEPTQYKKTGRDSAITDFSTFIPAWQSLASAVISAVPDVKLGGPDDDDRGAAWASSFAQAEQANTNVTSILYHFKPGGGAKDKTPQQMIDGMLSSSWDTSKYPSCYNSVGTIAQSHGLSYLFTEFNDYVAPAKPAKDLVNDYSFATALFALDALHWWAAHGCGGVYFHTWSRGFHAAFYIDPSGNYQLYPLGLGIAAFNVGGHGNVEPLAMTNAGGLNLTAYAVGDAADLFVTIVNKEHGAGARDAAVTIAANGFGTGSVAAMVLTQTNGDVTATKGISLGGSSPSGASSWVGQWTTLNPLTDGQCAVTVPAASATILRIRKS